MMSLKDYDKGICSACGQLHEIEGAHLYDYSQQVDEDLVCYICLQPLVEPIDTKCGHTYCTSCLKSFLKVQKICPMDRQHLVWKDCSEASIMVKRLLDKLLVVCPNVDYCEEVLPRCELKSHLKNRCKGAISKCLRQKYGCSYQGPRSALDSHMQYECPYRHVQTSGDIDDGVPKNPIIEGEITTIDIQRGCYDLGISIVGGSDTPLVCVVVQELLADGIAAKDGRLQPGDQILEVNGEDLTQVSHQQARRALELLYSICRLTVYRERSEDNSPIEKEEILRISLNKQKGSQLGIKLVGKKHTPGLYVLDVIPDSVAAQDNRLKQDDRILEINCQDMSFGTQDQAASIIKASVDKVQFVVSRRSRPQTPDLIRSASHDQITESSDSGATCRRCEERQFTVPKDPKESLGMSVAGGYDSLRGDIPLYVTNIQPTGCLGRSKQIKRGDIILFINGTSLRDLTHKEAVHILKTAAESKSVTLRIIEGPETSDAVTNFSPSWQYWLNLPLKCHIVKTLTIQKGYSQSLGFSIVGGIDSPADKQGIHVKSLVPGSPAFKDGRLRCGDVILSVDSQDIRSMSHATVVQLLKNTKGLVTLEVVSWPGSLV